ncbi:MAG TPA: DUF4249 domain-containing protein [Ferruginibacter sp.]|nr:DUF4249 domain-containing protein [Chitinophagaceae bacterium]HRD42620.1 DUF4249 domain-containing protein [Ferruginibacter sp.]
MKPLLLLFGIILFSACEKDVNFKLEAASQKLVVDASIENGLPPRVVLTKTTPFFASITPAILDSSFVHNAIVEMSNGLLTHRLKEYAYPLAPGFWGYYYGIDSAQLATAFVGALHTQYSLKVLVNGKEYTSSIGIPGLDAHIDSIWTKPAPHNEDSNARVLMVKATDPPGLGNFVRYYTKVNSEPMYPGYNSVFSDEVIDGSTFTLEFSRGVDKNDPPSNDSNFFAKGDTITLKFCNIQKPVYTFWSTWEFAWQSIGNPFAQPNTVQGNISNGALGAFCGYAAAFRTIISN